MNLISYINKYFFLALFIILLILGIFRNATYDEVTYLQETITMTELIKQGIWFGNYAVGLHGFLFKLPVALLFLITGPSVQIATLFNTVLAFFCLTMFYKILVERLTFKKPMAKCVVFLLFSSFGFVTATSTFLREIPVLLTFLIFTYFVLKPEKNYALYGILLLLVLEAKEYVFFMIAPAYILWILIYNQTTKAKLINLTKSFLPVLTYLIIMFGTSAIPINMYNALILGCVEVRKTWLIDNFQPSIATRNLYKDTGAGEKREMPLISIDNLASRHGSIIGLTINGGNLFLQYLGKVLYPRTFSFLSVPKLIVVPALFSAISMFFIWRREKKNDYLILNLMLFSYIIIYIARTSHGRYLFPISPLIFIFFIIFVEKLMKSRMYSICVFLTTLLFIIGGLFFETLFTTEKIVLNLFLFLALCSLWLIKNNYPKYQQISIYLFVVIFGLAAFATSILFSYTKGQMHDYILWGYNKECGKIMSNFNNTEKIWVNDAVWGTLPLFFRRDISLNSGWDWSLDKWIPKKHLIETLKNQKTFSSSISTMQKFKETIKKNNITKVALVESTLNNYEFPTQNKLEDLKKADWLTLTKFEPLKNKNLYIFSVNIR